jgi:predicted nucleotidyltransferase
VKPSAVLKEHRNAIRRIVESNRARNARVFGSVATGEDHEGSDLDILVDALADTSLLDLGAIRAELQDLLGVPVDVLTPDALPERMRSAVLAQAVPV